jgi:hypothetical protein
MYLDSKDYQTVWQLAHNWTGADPDKNSTDEIPTELKEAIHRLMHAASACKNISCKKLQILNCHKAELRQTVFISPTFYHRVTKISKKTVY